MLGPRQLLLAVCLAMACKCPVWFFFMCSPFLNCNNLVFLFCFVDGGSCVVVNTYVECLVLLMVLEEKLRGIKREANESN
jgi:hypothetical protein